MVKDTGIYLLIGILKSRICLLFTLLSLTVLLLVRYTGPIADIQTIRADQFQKRVLVNVQDNLEPRVSTKPSSTSTSKPRCLKHTDVSFLKVHKAGSTTVMNIFLRFAIQHGLNIVLPDKPTGFGFNYLGYGKTVSKDRIVPLPPNQTYNILCNHVVYNKKAFRSIMPNDTKYIGIIREPESHFRSAMTYFGFYGHLEKFNKENNLNINGSVLTEFFRNPQQFRVGTYYVHDKMSFDLGLPKEKFDDDEFIENYITELDNDYELMLLMERFDESLVLMKRLLCWDMKDILYVPLNTRKTKLNISFSEEDRKRLKKWNRADFKLYDRFQKVFDEKRIAQGADFEEEVMVFKKKQKQVEDYCHKLMESPKKTPPIYFVKSSKFDTAFQVTKRDCFVMMEPELHIMKRLIEEAWITYNSSKHH